MNIKNTIKVISLSSVVVLLSACGQDDDGKTTPAPKAAASVPAPAAKPAPAPVTKPAPAPMAKPAPVPAPAAKPAPVAKAAPAPTKAVEAKVSKAVASATSAPKQSNGAKIFTACVGCHGASGQGGVGPKLQGRPKAELLTALKEYKAGKQRGPLTSMMAPNVQNLSPADLDAVATYITTLK